MEVRHYYLLANGVEKGIFSDVCVSSLLPPAYSGLWSYPSIQGP